MRPLIAQPVWSVEHTHRSDKCERDCTHNLQLSLSSLGGCIVADDYGSAIRPIKSTCREAEHYDNSALFEDAATLISNGTEHHMS